MAQTSFAMEIVTPEGIAFKDSARSLKLPGTDGSFGVLARHAPLLAALDIGILEVEDPAGQKETWAIGEGFVQVTAGEGASVRVLTDFANRGVDVDVARAQAAEQRARERLKARAENVDRVRAEVSLRRSLVRLKVARN